MNNYFKQAWGVRTSHWSRLSWTNKCLHWKHILYSTHGYKTKDDWN